MEKRVYWHAAIFLMFALLMSQTATSQAEEKTIVSGAVFNIFLEELNSAIITIDTQPEQTIVSKDGTYSFTLSPGEYTLRAIYYSDNDVYETEQKIEIKEKGNYNIDLILLPSLEKEDQENDEFDIPEQEETAYIKKIIIALATILVATLIYLKKRKSMVEPEIKSESEDGLDNIVQYLKDSGGRSTQKDIRRKFPSSEAKISLMLTDLESRGIIKRIKKGRSNVIVLEKR